MWSPKISSESKIKTEVLNAYIYIYIYIYIYCLKIVGSFSLDSYISLQQIYVLDVKAETEETSHLDSISE